MKTTRYLTLKQLIVVAVLALTGLGALAQSPTEYRKKNGVVEIGAPSSSAIPFSISSAVGQNACSVEGKAEIIDANRAGFTSNDLSDKCVVLLNFSGRSVQVTTKDCESSCGNGAAGSMDGLYRRR